ncbi:hypothetical protein C8R47DRAFT_1181805 [Mycena vitilis]|nr:hypothetical protein C8R47DRAFT_1181805 [Mycena vitilis]
MSLPDGHELDHEGQSLWRHILSAEQDALQLPPKSSKYDSPLVGIRVLGFMLLDLWHHRQHSFGAIPYKQLISQITSCLVIKGAVVNSQEETDAQHQKLQETGLHLRNHLIHTFRAHGGPIPKSSEHPSHGSLDTLRERFVEEMKTPTSSSSARKKASRIPPISGLFSFNFLQSLLRDGYRCMLTGQYDVDSVDDHPELGERATAANVTQAITQCAHIFSETAQDSSAKLDYAGSAMAILKVFGLDSKDENMWFEEVIGQENTYRIVSHHDKSFKLGLPLPRVVTFQVDPAMVAACADNGVAPPALPSPSLLAIRAACSRVAHMSGAAEQVNQFLRDYEDTAVMANDGGSAALLEWRLLHSTRMVDVNT